MDIKMDKFKELGIDQVKFNSQLKSYAKGSNLPEFLISERALELAGKVKPGEKIDTNVVLNTATKDLVKASQAVKQAEPVADKGKETKATLERNRLEVARKIAEHERLINIIAGAGAAEKEKSETMNFGSR